MSQEGKEDREVTVLSGKENIMKCVVPTPNDWSRENSFKVELVRWLQVAWFLPARAAV